MPKSARARPACWSELLVTFLASRGLGPTRVHIVVEPCGIHDERAWARRLPQALRFLYGRPRPS